MEAIKNEIDAFQTNCENLLRAQQTQEESTDEGSEVRGDVFLQSSIRMQSALIGKVLLEVKISTCIKDRLMMIAVGFMGK